MGILLQDAERLLEIFSNPDAGASHGFGRTLTLGRQQLFFDPASLESSLRAHQVAPEKIQEFSEAARNDGMSESFFKMLGASEVASMDYSSYEGASIQHDLNQPIPDSLREGFDIVFDGGTLEHVFHFPQALRNAMELVCLGGRLIISTPMNNMSGHGFYQFSPELFYNVLSAGNGFEIEMMVAHELSPAGRCFDVADPSAVQSRVLLTNSWPVILFVSAVRRQVKPIFEKTPQQTDYQRAWNSKSTQTGKAQVRDNPSVIKWKTFLKSQFPESIYRALTLKRSLSEPEDGFGNSKVYRKRNSIQ